MATKKPKVIKVLMGRKERYNLVANLVAKRKEIRRYEINWKEVQEKEISLLIFENKLKEYENKLIEKEKEIDAREIFVRGKLYTNVKERVFKELTEEIETKFMNKLEKEKRAEMEEKEKNYRTEQKGEIEKRKKELMEKVEREVSNFIEMIEQGYKKYKKD